MNKFKMEKKVLVIAAALSLLSVSSLSIAAGVRINLDTASDLGNALAGGAALSGDVSSSAFNPASLSYIHRNQLAIDGIGVMSNTIFTGSVSAPALTTAPFGTAFNATGRTTSNSNGMLPSVYYNYPVNAKWDLGFAFNEPFGLGLDFGENSMLRYTRIIAHQKSYNFAPSVSYRFNPHWSFGIGPNFQYYYADATVKTNTTAPRLGFTDSQSQNNADGWGFGGHAGLLYEIDNATRIGLSYKSQIKENLSGSSTFQSGTVTPLLTTNNHFRLKFMLPANTMLSIYRTINPQWAVMGTVDYTQWSSYNYVRSFNSAQLAPLPGANTVTTFKFRNTWHGAIAANYTLNQYWLFRLGLGYDQKATSTLYRTVDFPNGNVLAVGIGGRYSPTNRLFVDIGYLHSFIHSTFVNTFSTATSANENGKLQTYSNVLGAQVVLNIA